MLIDEKTIAGTTRLWYVLKKLSCMENGIKETYIDVWVAHQADLARKKRYSVARNDDTNSPLAWPPPSPPLPLTDASNMDVWKKYPPPLSTPPPPLSPHVDSMEA